jgi:hypothetical protein
MSRHVPEKLAGVDQAAAAFEGEIREFVRRDDAMSETRLLMPLLKT